MVVLPDKAQSYKDMESVEMRTHHGFTLVEIAIVLVIVGLALGMLLPLSSGMQDVQKRQAVQTKLSAIDTAMVNFVAQNRRLPCPADGTIATGAAGAGVETLNPGTGLCVPANQANGVVPWVTLGLSDSDASDPWAGRISYRVFPPLAFTPPAITPVAVGQGLLDMTACDPAGTSITPIVITGGCGGFTALAGCTQCATAAGCAMGSPLGNCVPPATYLAAKGLDVWNGVGGAAGWVTRTNNRAGGSGAAYVLISHGPSGAGAYNGGGILQPGNVAPGTDEAFNSNGIAVYTAGTLATTYRDAQLTDLAGATHFDDYLSHPTIMTVLQKANLGPRAH